ERWTERCSRFWRPAASCSACESRPLPGPRRKPATARRGPLMQARATGRRHEVVGGSDRNATQPGPVASTGRAPNRWAVLALLGVAQLMVVLDATIVTIALPSAQKALHFSYESRQWIVTAYALAFGSLLLLGGKLGDL